MKNAEETLREFDDHNMRVDRISVLLAMDKHGDNISKRYEALVEALDEYIELLCEELDESAPNFYYHGWRTKNWVDEADAQAKIKSLRK